MKTKSHFMKAAVFGLLFMAIPVIMKAQDDNTPPRRFDGAPGGHRKEHHERMAKDKGPGMEALPGITDQQKQDIHKIHIAARKDILPLQNKIGEKMAHLKTLNTAEKPDMKAINSTIDEVYALKGEIAKKQAQSRQEVRKLLTEEQRLIFDSHPHRGGHGEFRKGRM